MSSRRILCHLGTGPCRETVETVDLTSGRSYTPLKHRLLGYAVLLLGVFGLSTARLSAAESSGIRVEAILVWATHVAKTNDTNLKELEPQLARRLSKRFKWNLYYEVRRKEATVSNKDATHVPISEKCSLDVKHLGDERFEVNLTGKGKPVSRTVESLAHGHIMIVGGDDKNDTAWLIVIRELPVKK